MNTEQHEFSSYWAVHSSVDDQPSLRAWATSEQDAQRRLAELQSQDEDAARTEYWVVRMTKNEVVTLKATGFLPADA